MRVSCYTLILCGKFLFAVKLQFLKQQNFDSVNFNYKLKLGRLQITMLSLQKIQLIHPPVHLSLSLSQLLTPLTVIPASFPTHPSPIFHSPWKQFVGKNVGFDSAKALRLRESIILFLNS